MIIQVLIKEISQLLMEAIISVLHKQIVHLGKMIFSHQIDIPLLKD